MIAASRTKKQKGEIHISMEIFLIYLPINPDCNRITQIAMKNSILAALLFLLPLMSFADLVTEGEVTHEFTILNLDEFEEYEFYILFQTYYYDRGYQEGPTKEMSVAPGKYFRGGQRSGTSPLYARLKSDENEGPDPSSSIRLGGRQIVAERNARSIQDDYRIVSINDSLIELELVEQRIMLNNGKKIQIKKGSLSSGMEVGGMDLIYFVLPGVCLLGILAFFVYRRRASGSANT